MKTVQIISQAVLTGVLAGLITGSIRLCYCLLPEDLQRNFVGALWLSFIFAMVMDVFIVCLIALCWHAASDIMSAIKKLKRREHEDSTL